MKKHERLMKEYQERGALPVGAFHAHRDPSNPECVADRGMVQHEFMMWEKRMVESDLRNNMDFGVYTDLLSVRTSFTAHRIETILLAMDTLVNELPTVCALQRRDFPLSIAHIIDLDRALADLTPEECLELDPFVAYIVSPKCEGDTLPTPKSLRGLITDLAGAYFGLPVKSQLQDRRANIKHHEHGNGTLDACIDSLTLHALDVAIKRIQLTDKDITRAEAFRRILVQKLGLSITLHAVHNVDNGTVYLPGIGHIPDADVRDWGDMIVEGAPLDSLADIESTGYQFTKKQKTFLQARDNTCRYPGCGVAATHCDIDHSINFADGGPTAASNGVCLCRKHHNEKTAGFFSYTLHEDGVIFFRLPDGTTAASIPTGIQRIKMRTVANIKESRILKNREEEEQQLFGQRKLDNAPHTEPVLEITKELIDSLVDEVVEHWGPEPPEPPEWATPWPTTA